MATPTNLRLDGLSYEQIRDNFRTFLKSQDQFRDYNFDSSGISTLIDILTYNTYYNSFYQNMVATETFLSTAQRRNSAVNLAKALNYTPRSFTSSKLSGNLQLSVVGSPAAVTLPKYTRFRAIANGETYYFLTQEPITIFRNGGGNYIQTGIELIEGTFVSERYVYDSNDPDQRFLISNATADTSTLVVKVQNSSVDTTVRVFSKPDNLVSLTSTTTAYFLEEVEDGKYQVTFGDGVIGENLNDGNIVYLEYIVSKGTQGNGIKTLELAATVENVTDITFTLSTVDAQSFGGQDRESIERIKFAAPKSYAAQNRAVTTEDYEAILLNEPNVGSVVVWGGEDNDPPAYGKVFVAIRPVIGIALTATEKKSIIDTVLKPKKVLTVATEIVDPEYIYLVITATAKYDPDQTIETEASIKSKVLDTIKNYNDTDLNQFSKYFRASRLTRLIDTSERSILSTTLSVRMEKEVDVQLNAAAKYTLNFSNPINSVTLGRPTSHPFGVGSQISSNEFSYGGFDKCFMDDNNGIIRIYRVSGTQNLGVSQNVGTIDYTTGAIVLTDFRPTAFADGGVSLRITAVPSENDILPLRGQIVAIRDADITINVINDKLISLVKR
jgi:hypothetical protein